jgi:hypothetical protein
MTNPALPGEQLIPSAMASPPPMPSIAASALLESRLLIQRTGRTVVAWLARAQ